MRIQRAAKLLLPAIALFVVGIAALAVGAPAPHRTKADCAKFVKDADESSARMGIKIRVATGSWGNVPRELQKLPPGAQHCGALMEQAVIMSPAFGKDLETFYAPLFAKIGCQPFACEVENISGGSRTECKCRGNGKIKMGQIVTDLSYEAFVLSVM